MNDELERILAAPIWSEAKGVNMVRLRSLLMETRVEREMREAETPPKPDAE